MTTEKSHETLEVRAGPWGSDAVTRTQLTNGLELRLAHAIPGELHRVRITHRSQGGPVVWGKSLELLPGGAPQGRRQGPPCPIHKQCGACGIQHVVDADQLQLKASSALRVFPAELREALAAESHWPSPGPTFGYRHKAVFLPAIEGGRLLLGGFKRRSHDVIDLQDCAVLAPSLIHAQEEIRSILTPILTPQPLRIFRPGSQGRPNNQGALRSLIMRSNRKGQVVLCAVVSAPQARSWLEPALHALVESSGPIVGCSMQVFASTGDAVAGPDSGQLVAGIETIDEQVGSISVRVQPLSFFQVNPFALESLVALLSKLALSSSKEVVGLLDLYCGGGVLGLAIASTSGGQVRLTGVDIDSRAIQNAREDAARSSVDARFQAGPAATLLRQLLPERGPFDLVLVDPPRRGLRGEAIEELKASEAKKILYVSCHGPSLARDSLLLQKAGYRPTLLMPLDMLPQTAHLEWIALFSKNG